MLLYPQRIASMERDQIPGYRFFSQTIRSCCRHIKLPFLNKPDMTGVEALGDFLRIIYPQAGLFIPFPRCKKGCIARYAPLFTPCSEQKSCACG